MEYPDLVRGESFGGLVRGVLMDLRMLIREELALARVELREQAGRARTVAISFAITAGALAFGVIFLLVAAATGIADLLDWPAWAGFLTVALLLSLLGVMAMASGRRQLRQIHIMPEETVSTLKENATWIAKRLSSDRK